MTRLIEKRNLIKEMYIHFFVARWLLECHHTTIKSAYIKYDQKSYRSLSTSRNTCWEASIDLYWTWLHWLIKSDSQSGECNVERWIYVHQSKYMLQNEWVFYWASLTELMAMYSIWVYRWVDCGGCRIRRMRISCS